ncbi:MAG: hypothetical protein ACOC0T_05120, partial [Desulfovermiculus sp.]
PIRPALTTDQQFATNSLQLAAGLLPAAQDFFSRGAPLARPKTRFIKNMDVISFKKYCRIDQCTKGRIQWQHFPCAP